MRLQIFLMLPALVASNFTFEYYTAEYLDDNWKRVLGRDANIITNKEKLIFKLTDERIKNTIDYFTDRPEKVYFHSPVPEPDPYKYNNWPPVRRILVPDRTKVLFSNTKRNVVVAKEFVGDGDRKVDLFSVSGNVTNSLEVIWLNEGCFDMNGVVTYLVDGAATMSVQSDWEAAVNTSENKSFFPDPLSPVVVIPRYGQVVVATLSTKKITVKIQVDYLAQLVGDVVAYFPGNEVEYRYRRHDIKDILKAGDYPNTISSSQIITIVYHSRAKIVVKDKATMKKLAEVETVSELCNPSF